MYCFTSFLFQILMESPIINLELKSHGGITPLMLAVKMGNTRALQMLLAKNAEITSTDIEGLFVSARNKAKNDLGN